MLLDAPKLIPEPPVRRGVRNDRTKCAKPGCSSHARRFLPLLAFDHRLLEFARGELSILFLLVLSPSLSPSRLFSNFSFLSSLYPTSLFRHLTTKTQKKMFSKSVFTLLVIIASLFLSVNADDCGPGQGGASCTACTAGHYSNRPSILKYSSTVVELPRYFGPYSR